jgi:hypothetical protein
LDRKQPGGRAINWEAIGAIGEIVGAAAVVVTLAYLAVQIRNNTRIARSVARQSIAQMAMAHGTDFVADKGLAAALLKDFKGQDVDEADWVRLLAHNYISMRHYENIHYQHLTGMISSDEWQGFRENLKAVLEWRSMRAYWKNEAHYFSDAFRAEVSAIQSDVPDANSTLSHSYVIGSETSE